MIEEFYGDRTAKRSGVPLINHINEGTRVLEALNASEVAIQAYRLHPIFQNDADLLENFHRLKELEWNVIALVMEYRNIANASLSDIVYWDYMTDQYPLRLKRRIKISPIDEVNKMLIADKVQNWKDFRLYHKDTHDRSHELDFYFKCWLEALEVDEGTANFLVGVCYG